MSVLEYPDAFDAPELQIWNNAAFDNGESEDIAAAAVVDASWSSSVNPVFVKLSGSLESDDFSKENRCPDLVNSHVSLESTVLQSKQSKAGAQQEDRSRNRNIDAEIEEIEREISRLSSRLEALRVEKAKNQKPRCKIVAAKFMEQKPVQTQLPVDSSVPVAVETPLKPKLNRRGLSLGPTEILASSAVKSRPTLKPAEITPVLSNAQSRRKSCFWKLEEIDELRVTKERRKSMSMTTSPNSRKTTAQKIQPPKQAVTAVGSKRFTKKEEAIIASIQPKKLFAEGAKSAPAKKPAKSGRIVASRYNQITISAARKRSFPENEKEEMERLDKRRTSSGANKNNNDNQGAEGKATKKKWEIPSELVVACEGKTGISVETPSSIGRISEALPRIKATRWAKGNSPRDSGAAKRVAELVGRRSYFGNGDDEVAEPEMGFCQALSFVENVQEEEEEEED